MAELKTCRFILTGLSCVNCAQLVERSVADLAGVASARADFAGGGAD